MMNHGDYNYLDGSDSWCGIRTISKQEQLAYIQNAVKNSEYDTAKKAKHLENWNYFEADDSIKRGMRTQIIENRPTGYCKTVGSFHNIKHSVSPWCSYNCDECLANALVKARTVSRSIDVELSIHDSDATNNQKRDIKTFTKIDCKIANGVCEITCDNKITFVLNEFQFIVRENQNPIVIIKKCIHPKTQITLYGNAMAVLIGIPVCENILLGKQCCSLSGEIDARDFKVNSCPKGYPYWSEVEKDMNKNNKTRFAGTIWVHRKCRECSEQEKSNEKNKNQTTNVNAVTFGNDSDNKALEARENTIFVLLTEIRKLRSDQVDLLIKIQEYEKLLTKNNIPYS